MRKKTYNNVMRGAAILRKKGYEPKEAVELSLKFFDEYADAPMPIEFYLNKVLDAKEFKAQYKGVFNEK